METRAEIARAMGIAYINTKNKFDAVNAVREQFDGLTNEDAQWLWEAIDCYCDEKGD
jgi:hypothetical protein